MPQNARISENVKWAKNFRCPQSHLRRSGAARGPHSVLQTKNRRQKILLVQLVCVQRAEAAVAQGQLRSLSYRVREAGVIYGRRVSALNSDLRRSNSPSARRRNVHARTGRRLQDQDGTAKLNIPCPRPAEPLLLSAEAPPGVIRGHPRDAVINRPLLRLAPSREVLHRGSILPETLPDRVLALRQPGKKADAGKLARQGTHFDDSVPF